MGGTLKAEQNDTANSQQRLAQAQHEQTKTQSPSSSKSGNRSRDFAADGQEEATVGASEEIVPTFAVNQTHLPEQPSELVLHVAFEGLKLFVPDGLTPVQLIPYENIVRFRRLKEGAGLALTLTDGSGVILPSEEAGGSEIYDTVQAKVEELAMMLKTDSRSVHLSADEEAKLAAKYLPKSTMGDSDAPRKDEEPKKKLMRRFSVSLADRPPPMGGVPQPSVEELAAIQSTTEAAMATLVEAQAGLRHKVSALMRAGDTKYLAEQMPAMQAKTTDADREYKKCLAKLPDDLRAASERRLRELLDLDEAAARKEDVIKDAAPVAVKKKMAKAARTKNTATRRYSVAVGAERARVPVATVQSKKTQSKVRSGTSMSLDTEVKFEVAGPLGVVWTSVVTGAGDNMACVKSVKSGSVADKDGGLQPGMLLGFIDGADATGLDYFDLIRLIRETRPVTLVRPFSNAFSNALHCLVSVKACCLNCLCCAQGFCSNTNTPASIPTPEPALSTLDDLPTLQEGEEGSEEDDDGDEDNPMSAADAAAAAAAEIPDEASPAQPATQTARSKRPPPSSKAGPKRRNMSVLQTGTERRTWDAKAPSSTSKKVAMAEQPATSTATFSKPGPLGIVWSQVEDKKSGGVVACVKAVKPGSVAESDGQVRPGMLLGYIGGEWVQGLDYLDQITMIRDVSPALTLSILCLCVAFRLREYWK